LQAQHRGYDLRQRYIVKNSIIDYNAEVKIGAHLSVAGGYTNALKKTLEIGGNCLQIFSSSPRNWGVLPVSDEQISLFLAEKKKLSIDPLYFHASYLINLANPEQGGKASVETLIAELQLAEKMDVIGTIIHLGTFNGENYSYPVLLKNIAEVLKNAPADRYFIIENAGNNKIGKSIDQIAEIMADLCADNVRVCLDTCHLFAAGYDLSTKERYKRFFSDFDAKIGLNKLELIQVNDSKDTLGSGRDRHENIGEGNIPTETFVLYLNEPETQNLPFILEVPGENKEGPDKKNVAALRKLSRA
jgi:deoxyribonuclease IV